MRIYDMFTQGGALVWVIAALGLVALIVFLERSLYLHRSRIKADDFVDGLLNVLRKNNTREALAICERTPGPVAYLARTAIANSTLGRESMEQAAKGAAVAETSRLERRLVVLATIAQLAPVLGLLGTVVGMVEMATVMSSDGILASSRDLSFGLMKALFSTVAGLIVMIPSIAAFNVLVVKIDRLVLDMERSGRDIITFLLATHRVGEPGNESAAKGTAP